MVTRVMDIEFRVSNFELESGGRESGYTLVIIVLTIAIMSIFMAVAVQTVEFQMRREREAELIFRGQQYVEAIRLYKAKYGRHPMQLKEIWEAKPKVIRKPWKDPITDSEDWGLIFLGQEGRRIGPENAFPGTPIATETARSGLSIPWQRLARSSIGQSSRQIAPSDILRLAKRPNAPGRSTW